MSMLMTEIFNRGFSEDNDGDNRAIKILQLVFVFRPFQMYMIGRVIVGELQLKPSAKSNLGNDHCT